MPSTNVATLLMGIAILLLYLQNHGLILELACFEVPFVRNLFYVKF